MRLLSLSNPCTLHPLRIYHLTNYFENHLIRAVDLCEVRRFVPVKHSDPLQVVGGRDVCSVLGCAVKFGSHGSQFRARRVDHS